MATPSTLSYGTVVGQFLVSASDSADADTLPDAVPASGTVTFTPSAGVVLDYSETPNPSAILRKPIVSTLDAAGYITGADGTRGIKLLATDNPTVKPVGWTWVATYALKDAEGNALRTLTTQPFYVPSNGIVDLIEAMPIGESHGVLVTKGDKGDFATISVGSVSVGNPSISINQVDGDAEVSFVLPVSNLQIGTVETGEPVDGSAVLPDTGWRQVPVTPVASQVVGGNVRWRRVGNRVYLRLVNVQMFAGATGDYAFISAAEMPQGFRPGEYEGSVFWCNSAGSTNMQAISVTTDVKWTRTISFAALSTTRPSSLIYGTLSWITEDAWPTTLPGTAV